jgi:hypothetical protein
VPGLIRPIRPSGDRSGRVGDGARAAARLAVPMLLIGWVLAELGAEPFRQAGRVVSPTGVAAALALGLVTTLAQARRWRAVALGHDAAAGLTHWRAVAECYRAAFLNVALPGGWGGDAVRMWRRTRDLQPRRSAGPRQATRDGVGQNGVALSAAVLPILVERSAGSAVLFGAAAAATAGADGRLAPALVAVALVASGFAIVGCRRLAPSARVAVLGWSVVTVAGPLALVAVAGTALGTVTGWREILLVGVILLAASSLPVGLAGFGPRESVAAVTAGMVGLSATQGVSTAVGFGVLVVVSVLPGAAVLVLDRPGGSMGGEVELDADVLAQDEPAGRGPQRVPEPVGAREPQPGNAVTDEQRGAGQEQSVHAGVGDEAGHGGTAALDQDPAQATAGQSV